MLHLWATTRSRGSNAFTITNCNSKAYGAPQNRERVFIVGHLGAGSGRKIFPVCPADGENPCKLQELTSGEADANRVYDANGLARTRKGEAGGGGAKTGLYLIGD